MRWQGERQSENVEDRRGSPARKMAVGGGLGAIVLAVIIYLMGGDPGQVMQNLPTTQESTRAHSRALTEEEKKLGEFASVILAETEDVWHKLLDAEGRSYREPKLVLFSQATESGCGFAQSATGPFYCPGDEKVYIDLGFFQEMQERLGMKGDFACAYVIAHEVGHHVQNQLGIMEQVERKRNELGEQEFNRYSVRLELQADFLAGVWAHHLQRMRDVLEPGDIEEGINAAAAVGDDRLQKNRQGYAVPDSFTHGTSAQRVRWFTLGYQTGDLSKGDTFAAAGL
jgi:uncharacterized protein